MFRREDWERWRTKWKTSFVDDDREDRQVGRQTQTLWTSWCTAWLMYLCVCACVWLCASACIYANASGEIILRGHTTHAVREHRLAFTGTDPQGRGQIDRQMERQAVISSLVQRFSNLFISKKPHTDPHFPGPPFNRFCPRNPHLSGFFLFVFHMWVSGDWK